MRFILLTASSSSRVISLAGATLFGTTLAFAQVPVLVTAAPNCELANLGGTAILVDLSSDGRFAAFSTHASNLVPGDTNARADAFVKDILTGAVERVSVTSGGAQGTGDSFWPRVSGDGRFVAFESPSILVANDTNLRRDVYVRDRQLSTTLRASVSSSGTELDADSFVGAISPDGRSVAFWTSSSLVVSGDTLGLADVFVRDLAHGSTSRVSVATGGAEANGHSHRAALSADGRFVAFRTVATNLDPRDPNTDFDIYLHDRDPDANGTFDEGNGTTELVSVDITGTSSAGSCEWPTISPDGRFVVFESEAANLVAGDTNAELDVFVRDRLLGITERVSVGTGGLQGSGSSFSGSISADGRFVGFNSTSLLTAGDTNGNADVFLRDRSAGTTRRLDFGLAGNQLGVGALAVDVSDDGRRAAYLSPDPLVVPGDTNNTYDVFAILLDPVPAGTLSSCSGDGSVVACPCGNNGAPGRGCANSFGPGAELLADGTTAPDTLKFYVRGMPPGATTILLQGDALIAPVPFGDGLRCSAGNLRRIGRAGAFLGAMTIPACGTDAISTRSALVGDPLTPGMVRHYTVYYRDASATFCPAPTGSTSNATQTLSVVW